MHVLGISGIGEIHGDSGGYRRQHFMPDGHVYELAHDLGRARR
jgi:hypothetical protein